MHKKLQLCETCKYFITPKERLIATCYKGHCGMFDSMNEKDIDWYIETVKERINYPECYEKIK